MLRILYISITFLIGICSISWGQTNNMVFEKFTANGALEGKSIIRMVQDQEGFIWFGAVDGLYRYDGNQVKEFRYDEEDSTSLSDNYIRALHVSSSGDLWVGTWNQGLNKYDPEREAFIRFQYQSGKASGISANSIEDLFEDSYGRLWVCTGNAGLSLFNEKNETFQHFVGPAYMKNDSLWRVVEDRDQKLWIGHRDGVDVLDLNTFEKADLPLEFDQLRTYWVTALHEDTKGDIWLGTWRNGLYKWDKNQKRLDKVRYSDGEEIIGVKDFFDGSDDNLWIAAGNLGFWNPEKNEVLAYQSAENADYKIEEVTNWPIMQDREGEIWVAGWNSISRYQSERAIWDYSYSKLFKEEPFFNDAILRILPDEKTGNLWIVWEDAIGYWDLSTQEIAYFDLQGKVEHKGESDFVRDIYLDTQGYLWLSTLIGAFRFDPSNNEIIHLNDLLDQSLPGLYIFTPEFVSDKQGNLWIASMENGLYYYNRKERNITIFSSQSEDDSSIGYNLIDHVYLDDDGILWLGTYGAGVERFDTRTRKVTHRFRHEAGNPSSLSQDRVIHLMEDDYEQIWIGTEDGLNVLDKNTFQITDLTKTIGLEKGLYSNIQKNGKGEILANFSEGLLVINPIDFGYDIISKADGINSSVIVGNDNRVYFKESDNNIVSFHLDSLKKNTLIPPVKITGLSYRRMEEAQERQFELFGISRKKSVKLSYLDDLITIDFAALSYAKPTQNQFKYRLLPSNPNWISLANQSSVNFMNLPPRNYTFEVMGSNGDGVWNPEPTSLEIIITPPWWASSLARLIYLLSFLSAVVIFIRLRLRSLIKRQKILEESVAERTHELAIAKQEAEEASEAKSVFLSTVSHELRTPLTSIIGFTKLNKKSLEEKILPAIHPQNKKALKAADQLNQNLEIVTTEGRRLTSLINDLLDLAKIEAGKVEWNMSIVDPQEIIQQALASTAVLFEGKKIKLRTHIQEDLGKIKADKDRIIQVIINLMSNAVKFTEEGEVNLSARKEKDNFFLYIKDTGKGIAYEDLPKVFEKFKQVGDNMTDKPQGTGLGLPICKEIIDSHKGEIWVESQEGKGSTFFFIIPLIE
jgi:two-component system sensor histidine kinase ChiS